MIFRFYIPTNFLQKSIFFFFGGAYFIYVIEYGFSHVGRKVRTGCLTIRSALVVKR